MIAKKLETHQMPPTKGNEWLRKCRNIHRVKEYAAMTIPFAKSFLSSVALRPPCRL